jgi:IS1 family transposase
LRVRFQSCRAFYTPAGSRFARRHQWQWEKVMRILLGLIFLVAFEVPALAAGTQQVLHDRCIAAIVDSGQPADRKALKETTIPLAESGFLFQFADPDGGTFSCQICDDGNPAVTACGSIGLQLSFRPKDGELKQLPAELDRKCTYFLQKEIKPRSDQRFIVHDIVKRIQVTAEHTDTRWVYQMQLDGNPYRCVIRKSDGTFRVEKQNGNDWKPLAAGSLF